MVPPLDGLGQRWDNWSQLPFTLPLNAMSLHPWKYESTSQPHSPILYYTQPFIVPYVLPHPWDFLLSQPFLLFAPETTFCSKLHISSIFGISKFSAATSQSLHFPLHVKNSPSVKKLLRSRHTTLNPLLSVVICQLPLTHWRPDSWFLCPSRLPHQPWHSECPGSFQKCIGYPLKSPCHLSLTHPQVTNLEPSRSAKN